MKQLKHLDITFDLETCSLAANAAVIQVAAVAWDRSSSRAEFGHTPVPFFEAKVDLRSCVMDGFDFDQETVKWWAEKPAALRQVMASGNCYPIQEVFQQFLQWMDEAKVLTGASSLSLWAQGADMDIAILRHVCRFYHLALPVSFHDFRDARTFIVEVAARHLEQPLSGIADHKLVYDLMPPLPTDLLADYASQQHNALYDALRTSWCLHECFQMLPPHL